MASIFRKPRSPFWFAAYRDSLGQRRQKTTKHTNRKLALDAALAFERVAEKGRNKTLTEAVARNVVSELVEQATGKPVHFYTCRGWLDEWLAGKAGSTAAGTLTRYKQVLLDFKNFLGERSNLTLAAISPSDVREFRDKLVLEKRAPSTVNLQIKKVLSVPFAAAARLGYIPINPCAAVEALRTQDSEGRKGFSHEQVERLLGKTEGDWHGAILAGYTTGLRLSDIANLLWEEIDFEDGLLRRKTQKRGKAVAIPLHPDFKSWLLVQTRGIGKAPIFPTLFGKNPGGAGGMSAQFAKLLSRAEIARRQLRDGAGAGHRTSDLSFHSLRHTFTSVMANAGVPSDVRKKLTGHTDDRTHAIYTHHDLKTVRKAVSKVPRIRKTER